MMGEVEQDNILTIFKVQQYVCVCLSAWIGLRYMHFMGGDCLPHFRV